MLIKLLLAKLVNTLICLLVFSINGTAKPPSECCNLSGYVLNNSGEALKQIPITVRRGGEVLRGDYKTDDNGYYNVPYREDRTRTLEAVIYGNAKWGPSIVKNLSGNRSHIINKVLGNAEQSKYSLDEALDVLATLDYLRHNRGLYSEEIVQFASVFRKESFPKELRPRLSEFEKVATAIKKERYSNEYPRYGELAGQPEPLRDAARASDAIAKSIGALITVKRQLAQQGKLTSAEELALTQALLRVSTADKVLVKRLKSLNAAPDAATKAELVKMFGEVTAALNELNTNALLGIKGEEARNRLTIIFNTINASVQIIQAFINPSG